MKLLTFLLASLTLANWTDNHIRWCSEAFIDTEVLGNIRGAVGHFRGKMQGCFLFE